MKRTISKGGGTAIGDRLRELETRIAELEAARDRLLRATNFDVCHDERMVELYCQLREYVPPGIQAAVRGAIQLCIHDLMARVRGEDAG